MAIYLCLSPFSALLRWRAALWLLPGGSVGRRGAQRMLLRACVRQRVVGLTTGLEPANAIGVAFLSTIMQMLERYLSYLRGPVRRGAAMTD